MKRISILLLGCALWVAPVMVSAQDAATEERLNKLNGLVQDLLESQEKLRKHIAELERELRSVRDESAKPNISYASQDELRKLAEKVQEIDRKREEDKKLIITKIADLGKALTDLGKAPPKRANVPAPAGAGGAETTQIPDKGYEHVVESGQTLSVIAQAYREKGIKVTVDQILKANPGLDPAKLTVGKKIFIPAPAK